MICSACQHENRDGAKFCEDCAAPIDPHVATVAADRFFEAVRSGNDERAVALVASDFCYQDHDPRGLLEGDVHAWIRSIRSMDAQSRSRVETLATIGNRIAISTITWIGNEDATQLHRISLIEADDSGRLRSVTLYDPRSRAEATLESLDRFAAGEAAGSDGAATYAAFVRALARRDWEAARERLSPTLRFDDHRPLRLGVLDGEQWLESLRAGASLAPDIAFEVSRVLAWKSHGFVLSLRSYGNLRDGGPFENVFLCIAIASGGRLTHVVPYPVDACDEAIARFEELTRHPSDRDPSFRS
jgi:hypothetical protein